MQNMPGAGGLRAANYIYNVAAKDGTVFGTFARHIPLLGFIKSNQNVQFDPVKFTWLGSSSSYENDAYLLIVRRGAKIKSVEEALRPGGPPIILGSTAEGASSDAIAVLVRDWLGFNVKIISGYRDSGALFLAIERGEIDGRTTGLSALRSNRPDWLRPNGLIRALVASGRATRHPGDQWTAIQEGEITFTVKGQPPKVLKAGDWSYVPRGTVHRQQNLGDKPARYIEIRVFDKGVPAAEQVTQ